MEDQVVVWQGDNNCFFLICSSCDLYWIDVCFYMIGQDFVVLVIKEWMNIYQEICFLRVLNGGKEII